MEKNKLNLNEGVSYLFPPIFYKINISEILGVKYNLGVESVVDPELHP